MLVLVLGLGLGCARVRVDFGLPEALTLTMITQSEYVIWSALTHVLVVPIRVMNSSGNFLSWAGL